MPVFNLQCSNCGKTKKVLRKTEQDIKNILCECGSGMTRDTQPLTSKVTEIIDNGLMPKKVEVISNIKESIEERKQKHRDRFKL